MNKEEIEQLLKRYRNGEMLSESEMRWLHSFYLHKAKRSKHIVDDLTLQENLSIIESAIKSRTARSNKFRRIYRITAAAASLLAILCLGYYMVGGGFRQERELTLANGQMRQIVLEDGTKITLNASSKLIYPKTFEEAANREVTLIGEAFFDVAKNVEKPFLIHTPRMEIRVLGTAFNVRDYKEDQDAETSLFRGKVEIWKSGKEDKKFVLNPKQKFVLQEETHPQKDQNSFAKKTVHVAVNIQPFHISEQGGNAVETEWMIKRVTIKDETLLQIAHRLERIYGVKITIHNKQVAGQVYSATFDDEKIDDVLKALQTVTPFKYQRHDNGHIEIN